MPTRQLLAKIRNIFAAGVVLVIWCAGASALLGQTPLDRESGIVLPDLTASLRVMYAWSSLRESLMASPNLWVLFLMAIGPLLDELVLLAVPFAAMRDGDRRPTILTVATVLGFAALLVTMIFGSPAAFVVQGGARVILGLLFLANSPTLLGGLASAVAVHAVYNFLILPP